MVTINRLGGQSINKNIEFYGLSTDEKPIEHIINGSILREIDTGKTYMFDAENMIWCEVSYI